MPRKREENILAEAGAAVRYLWRHRSGFEVLGRRVDHFTIGKKTVYIDNKIPALLQDTMENCGFITRDERRPVIAHKRKTDCGWHLIWHLPPGIAFSEVLAKREHFENACNAWIDMAWRNGALHMQVESGSLPSVVKYSWDPAPYSKMDLPVPIGVSNRGVEVLDLAQAPHMLVAGATMFGKSNFLQVLILSLLPRAFIAVIDPKRLDFAYLRDHCALARTDMEIIALLRAIVKEMHRRMNILEGADVEKVQEYRGDDLPFIVLIVDELAEIKNDEAMELLDTLVRLARALGISVVAATQRPSVKILPGDTRMNFLARVCFQVPSQVDSRVVLGEHCDRAAFLPGIKGRCIYRFGLEEREVQAMHLPRASAKGLVSALPTTRIQRRWSYEEPAQGKPQTNRLPPR